MDWLRVNEKWVWGLVLAFAAGRLSMTVWGGFGA